MRKRSLFTENYFSLRALPMLAFVVGLYGIVILSPRVRRYNARMDNILAQRLNLTRADWVTIAVLVGVALVARAIPGLRTIDDAYITYRYAYNLATGVGFVYNAGEAVLGTTTPLYTMVVAVLGLLTGNSRALYPQLSVIVNTIADAGGVTLLYLIGRKLFSNAHIYRVPGIVLGALWAVAPRSVTFAIGGMETSVYITLMLGAFCAWLYDRTILSATVTGFAVLTRPDALIWAGPLALGMIATAWVSNRDKSLLQRLPLAEGGAFTVVVAPWIVFSWATFGSPLTNSVSAKAVAYILEPLQALTALLGVYITPFSENVVFGEGTPLMIASVVYLLLYVVGGVFLVRRDWRSLPLVLFPWLYLITFSAANPLIFRWYGSPPIPLLMLMAVAGVWAVSRDVGGTRRAGLAVGVIGIVWFGFSLYAWELAPDHGPTRPAPRMAWHQLELLYEEAALLVANESDADAVVAAGDIGAVGWFADRALLDTLGLVSPQSIAFYPVDESDVVDTTAYAIATGLIEQEQPDYIVTLEAYVRNTLLMSEEFEEQYELVHTIETDIYGSNNMLIFRLR